MGKFVSEKIRKKSASRLAAVQATYEIAFTQDPVEQVIKDFVDGKTGRVIIEEKWNGTEEMLPLGEMDTEYFASLVKGVHEKKEALEQSLESFLLEGHSFERMDGTMQALLLCAVYEISTTLDVDVKVLIQEYVDLGYAFFLKSEPKMINALLDKVAHEIR